MTCGGCLRPSAAQHVRATDVLTLPACGVPCAQAREEKEAYTAWLEGQKAAEEKAAGGGGGEGKAAKKDKGGGAKTPPGENGLISGTKKKVSAEGAAKKAKKEKPEKISAEVKEEKPSKESKEEKKKRKREEEEEEEGQAEGGKAQLVDKQPCPELGVGWYVTTKRRVGGTGPKTADKEYIGPDGKKFNSRVKVRAAAHRRAARAPRRSTGPAPIKAGGHCIASPLTYVPPFCCCVVFRS